MFLGSAGFNSGGPETYERKLVQHLSTIDEINQYRLLCLSQNASNVLNVCKTNFAVDVLKPKFRPASMLITLTYDQYTKSSDVFHATYIPPPIAIKSYIYTLVCSTIFQHPEFYPPPIRARLWGLTRLALRSAKHTICISQNIYDIVRERHRLSEEQLSVVHLAADPIFRPIDADYCRNYLSEKYAIHTPYFFVCGRWEKRKNISRIIEAFSQFKKEYDSEIKLVFSGERKWESKKIDELISHLNLSDAIIDVGKSPFDELPILYSGALALVFPSLWEGFGLPIVEAMSCGTPVITSNISSTAEIAADAAICVDPYSVNDISESMYVIALDSATRDDLVTRGLARAAAFSWDQTARDTLAIYERFRGKN